jgi:Tol biopolymer transport system component
MPISRYKLGGVVLLAAFLAGCGNSGGPVGNTTGPTAFKDMPSVRLNFRYEGDVPAPAADQQQQQSEQRHAGVQADFDGARPQDEVLDRTIAAPNSQFVLAVWHKVGDAQDEYRLDMYDAAGKLLRKLTSDTMAARFPETIRWSPDSANVAFVAFIRTVPLPGMTTSAPTPPDAGVTSPPAAPVSNMQTGDGYNTNSAEPVTPPITAPTPAPPTGLLAFRTEQIYIANADGTGVKALTENEGIKYFYYVWSPDSSMLGALATTRREWQVQELTANGKGENMIPFGRPRIIEKNGRERRLDDASTQVHPVWSPDSAKLAVAYGNQIRVYDGLGTNPTQAAIPLRNQLLISSQAYDEQQKSLLQNANTGNANLDANAANANTPVPTQMPSSGLSVLPDEKTLVSYNPIVALLWPAEDTLYLETAYVKRMKNEADSVTSFARWHRVILTPQPVSPTR